jgi:hypothetical protein
VVVQTPPPHKAFTNFVLVFDRWVGPNFNSRFGSFDGVTFF